MALFNNFPYSNTEEINLDYTLNKLNELYSRGENLYAELQTWKNETDEANEAWKSDLLSDINEWQNSVTHSLEEWKTSVDSEVSNALTTLSNQITAELAQAKTDLRNEVADLASAAAASAADAAASQSAAAQSAQTAVNSAAAAAASANEIAASAEQIEDNKNDISDLKSALDASDLYSFAPIGISGYKMVSTGISTSNKWSEIGRSTFIPVSSLGKKIKVKANSGNVSVIAFLTSNEFANNQSVSTYASGTGRTSIPAGTIQEFDIPSDCKYLYVLDTWSDSFLPEYIEAYTLTFSRELSEDKIGLTVNSNEWQSYACVFATSYSSGNNRQGDADYNSTYNLSASSFVPVAGKMLQLPLIWALMTTGFPVFGMSLYDKNFNPIYGRAVSAYFNHGENDPYIVWVNIYLPENARYFRTTYWSAEFIEEHPDIPEFTYNLLKEIPEEFKPITFELPVDTYMQNAIRRSRQLTDIKWTPRVNIPRYSRIDECEEHFLDWFYADREYVGIPYSGAGGGEGKWQTIKDWGYSHNWVGQHIPIEAFITAARYPNSIMGEKASQSVVSYDSSPYGDVCTALVNYAVDGPTPLRGITNFFKTSDNAFRTSGQTITNINVNDISIGDFLYIREHVIFITDLIRDAYGNVIQLELSEETTRGNSNNAILGTKYGGVARRKFHSASEFKSSYGSYTLYRKATFYGISYTPSRFVDTGNEGDRELIIDMPCIPYLGEGAIYKVGYVHNSKVCIGATGFTSLVVLKDGEAFATFDVTGLSEVSVGFSAEGSYEAYLTKTGGIRTMSCHWTVEA